jgi:hypothetical protein
MLFAFDEDSIRSDVPSDFVRFFGSGFLSSIPEILAARGRPNLAGPMVSVLCQFADK